MNSSIGPFLVIIGGIALGILLRRFGRIPAEGPRVLNAYVISVALPALVLSQLPRFLHSLGNDASNRGSDGGALVLFALPLIPWLIFGVAIFFFGLFYRFGMITKGEWGLLALSGGLGNTAFVGFPLIEALLGRGELPHAILLDQLGTFLALPVAGMAWISFLKTTHSRFNLGRFLKDVLQFPPFLALLMSFFFARFGMPELLQGPLERFAATLVPVAMVSVGAQLNLKLGEIGREAKGVALGLGYKMVLAPFLILICTRTLFAEHHEILKVGVLEAAMAPMITSTVLGMEAGFAPELGALMLGVGIPLSLVSVPIWNWVLG